MQMKKLIINADDFGYSENNNIAIQKGFETGIITSTSLMANMQGFDNVVNIVIPQIPNIDMGFHFNIMEGKSLTDCPLLCNSDGIFQNSYQKLIIKSKDKEFMSQIEQEFRAQIEKCLKYCKISHLDSHVHTHAIPIIFNLFVELAKEYNIKYIRTQRELPYIVFNKVFNTKFPLNIVKNILLNTYSSINKTALKQTDLKTNDCFIGVLYTGYMDEQAILSGLKAIKKDNTVTEVIFHPYYSENVPSDKLHKYKEYLITQNPALKQNIADAGFMLTNYGSI